MSSDFIGAITTAKKQGVKNMKKEGIFFLDLKFLSLILISSLFAYLSCNNPTYIKTNSNPDFLKDSLCEEFAYEDNLYTCQLSATDNDIGLNWMPTEDEALTFNIEEAPDGMVIDPITGFISWTPTDPESDMFQHVKVKVEDIYKARDYIEFDIWVYRINDAPELISTCSSEATEDIIYKCDLNNILKNEENDSLVFSLTNPLDTMVINNGILTWVPSDTKTGENTVQINIADDKNTLNYDFKINAKRINDAPLLKWNCATTINEDSLYECAIEITDEEENKNISITPVNPIGDMKEEENKFSWTPRQKETGKFNLQFEVIDNNIGEELELIWPSEPIELTIIDVNYPPIFEKISGCGQSINEEETYECRVKITDKDNAPTEINITQHGVAMNIISETIENSIELAISFTPDDPEASEYQALTLTAYDGRDSTSFDLNVYVNPINDSPQISSNCNNASVQEGEYFECIISAYDPDSNELELDRNGIPNEINVARNSNTWELSFKKNEGSENETYNIEAVVIDNNGGESTMSFDIAFEYVNDEPVFISDTTDCRGDTITEGELYECYIDIYDEEGDEPIINISGEDIKLYDQSYRPNYFYYYCAWKADNQPYIGLHDHPITFDIEESMSSYSFTVSVNWKDDLPTIDIGDCATKDTTYVMAQYTCDIQGSDEETDIEFSLEESPTGMSIDMTTGIINYIASSSETHIGENTISVKVSDGTNEVTDSFDLSVLLNPAFGYAMLADRIDEYQFLYSVIRGKIGQVSPYFDLGSSIDIVVGQFYGDIILRNKYALDFHPDYPTQTVRFYNDSKVFEDVNDPSILPQSWPVILDRSDPTKPKIADSFLDLANKSEGKISGGKIWVINESSQYDPDSVIQSEIGPLVTGNAILIGEETNCLNITGNLENNTVNGVIIIDGDLIIKGKICGKGAIYVKRNIYIVDSLLYNTSPEEPVKNADGTWDLKDWADVKNAEERKGIEFDKLELYAGGNILFQNIALYNGGYGEINTRINLKSSGTIPIYNNDPSSDPFYDLYSNWDYTNDGKVNPLGEPIHKHADGTSHPYRIYQRENACRLNSSRDCVLSPNLRLYDCLVNNKCLTQDGEINGEYFNGDFYPYYDPSGLYAMDGSEGKRDADIHFLFTYDLYERDVLGYYSLIHDYDGDGRTGNLEGSSSYETWPMSINTAGLFPLGSKKDSCTSSSMTDYCFTDDGWIKASDFTRIAGYENNWPGSIDCPDESNPESLMYKLKYKKDGQSSDFDAKYFNSDGNCNSQDSIYLDKCTYDSNNDGIYDDSCYYKDPDNKTDLSCWVYYCSVQYKYIKVKCNDSDMPELLNPFKSPRIYAMLYAEGTVTGYKKSNAEFYNKEGASCKYTKNAKGYVLSSYNNQTYEWNTDYGFLDSDNDGITFYGAILARDINVYSPWGGWYAIYDNRNDLTIP
jgi:hypothetical protein